MFQKIICCVCSPLKTHIQIILHQLTVLHSTKSSHILLGHIYNFKLPFQLASVKCSIQTRSGPHLFYNIWGIFAMSNVGQVRLIHWLANADCAVYLPKVAQIVIIWAIFVILYAGHFRLTATLASVRCAMSLPKLAQIRFRITGPHLWHHMRATLGSQPH